MKDQEHLLIVENDPLSRRFFEDVATAEGGYVVHSCENAEVAWEFFQEIRPQIIILEWILGGADGLSLALKIRESEDGRYVTILMITAKDQPEALEEALKAGITYYATKPISRKFFRAWLAVARKNCKDMRQLRQYRRIEKCYHQELESLNTQLEDAIARANEMTVEASRACIEINQVFETVAGGIILIDTQFNITRFNAAFLRMVGASEMKVKTGKCYDIVPSAHCHTPKCFLRQIQRGAAQVQCDIGRTALDGDDKFYYYILATPFREPTGDLLGIVVHYTDITGRVVAEKALLASKRRYKELSIVDELTGLFNRRHFNKHLELEVERSRRHDHPLTLMIMDINNFKHHNDTYGHQAGDLVLSAVGQMLSKLVRANDLACRFGGDEFVVILPETKMETGLKLAERLRRSFAKMEFTPKEGVVERKTLSLGVAQFEVDDSIETLLARADENLYKAKAADRNRSVLG